MQITLGPYTPLYECIPESLTSLARGKLQILSTAMRFGCLSTNELSLVPVFTWLIGIPHVECLRACPVLAMQAYVEQASLPLYIHSSTVSPFQHAFMS